MCTPRLPVIDWTDTPVDLNGLVCFAERRNLVSARVPSHSKRSLHHEAEFSVLLVSVQHESAGESRASLLGVSCLQCTHVMQCDPKGQPDWNYFNSILLWTWCTAMPTVIGAAWIFMCAASISGGRRCSLLHLQNCFHCLERVPELYTFLYCIVYYYCLHLC